MNERNNLPLSHELLKLWADHGGAPGMDHGRSLHRPTAGDGLPVQGAGE